MLRYVAMFLGLVLLAGTTSAGAASFDCAKASTRVEKLICSDPQLSHLDDSLAAAYREALKLWDGRIAAYVKLTQRGWMGERTLLPAGTGMGGVYCEDDAQRLSCLRGLYIDRIAILKSPGFRLSGMYYRGKDMLRITSRPGGLELGLAQADPNAVQVFTEEGKPVPVAAGQTTIVFPLMGEGNEACRLEAAFTVDAVVLTSRGPCSGARLGGRWLRNQAFDPEGEQF
ncbi:lysozyme inhibitor LprI family protein [Sphingomonas alpina]|uniref:DUF1311 domain-containing protein n=1 Tax=Sphingomonas alpina TaxID=653931 RepID=A0A7H0LQ18_9SPHN|nr:hypothetical protein [Sphingomonas alpina]QNQ11771.1 hypothetical protein H3Z74_11910 [Sphingomonas alpina]